MASATDEAAGHAIVAGEDDSWWGWLRKGSGWFGSWNEEGGWSDERVEEWLEEGTDLAGDTYTTVKEEAGDVAEAIGAPLEEASSTIRIVAIGLGLAAAAYLLRR